MTNPDEVEEVPGQLPPEESDNRPLPEDGPQDDLPQEPDSTVDDNLDWGDEPDPEETVDELNLDETGSPE